VRAHWAFSPSFSNEPRGRFSFSMTTRLFAGRSVPIGLAGARAAHDRRSNARRRSILARRISARRRPRILSHGLESACASGDHDDPNAQRREARRTLGTGQTKV
jgi:hypothetical protein